MFKRYLKNSIWDYLICFLMAWGFAFNVVQGFLITDVQAGNAFGAALISAVCLAVFFLLSYNRTTIIAGIIGIVAAIALTIVYINSSNMFGEVAETYEYLFYIIGFFFTLVVFLLTRTKAGTISLFIIGIIAFAYVVFLEYTHFIIGFIAFLWGCVSMLFYKNYRKNVLSSDTVKTSLGGYAAISAIMAVVILAFSFGTWAAVIQPLNPPTQELKLIQKMKSLEIMDIIGVSSKLEITNWEEYSQKLKEEERLTNDETDKEDTPQPSAAPLPPEQYETDVSDNKAHAITYEQVIYTSLIIAITLIVLIIAAVVLYILNRKRRYQKMLGLPPGQSVQALFRFYLSRLERVGFDRNPYETLHEYTRRTEPSMRLFNGENATFSEISEVYSKVTYGGLTPTETELQKFSDFYCGFYKSCRKQLGTVKYLFKFFRL